jgi:hypothetical protein
VLSIDHVVLGVTDLDATAARLFDELGLASIPGGRHVAWGTANRIIPLGDDYIELLAVVDPNVASEHDFGRFMQALTANGDHWFTICLADDDLDGTASRLGLDVVTGERERPDGSVVRWRSCGLEDPERASWMPFFIDWDVPLSLHPGRAQVEHRVRPSGLAWIAMGDDGRLVDWLGAAGDGLPIRIVDGEPGVHAVAVASSAGELLL